MSKVGIFDSGLGGLTVARAIARRFPASNLIYLGDTARLPYGAKSEEAVTRYAVRCVRYLVELGAETIVVACNTASACALPTLQATYGKTRVLGVIEPGARAAVAATTSGAIGVIGTERTVSSRGYHNAIAALAPDARVTALATPVLVPLVETGWIDHPVTRLTIETYLQELHSAAPGIDTLVLGCTHYPVLRTLLTELTTAIFGRTVHLVDSAEAIAEALAPALMGLRSGDRQGGLGERHFAVTDLPASFAKVAATFWPETLPPVEAVDLTMD
ncbi:MAG: glutamate racemase [Myxococcales bacterium]|nr:glutamate racemase [Myxococcales bacterium]